MANWKKILIRVGIAIVIFIISFTLITKFVAGSTKPAYLHIESGTVEVNTGNGWQGAEEGMSLSKKDSVRTLEGAAVIVLYDSSFIKLESNTEISIESLSKSGTKINQASGETWNKFTKITGMSGYEVETPNTVATVRGTAFLINADEEKIIVSEGIVDYRYGDIEKQVNEFEKYVKGEKQDLTEAERAMLIQKLESELEIQKTIRLNRMQRMRIVNWVRERYTIKEGKDMTEKEQMNAFLDSVDSGEVSDREIMKKAPLINQHPAAKQFLAFNDEIKEQEDRLRKLQGKQQEIVEEINIDVSDDNEIVINTVETGNGTLYVNQEEQQEMIDKAEKVEKMNINVSDDTVVSIAE